MAQFIWSWHPLEEECIGPQALTDTFPRALKGSLERLNYSPKSHSRGVAGLRFDSGLPLGKPWEKFLHLGLLLPGLGFDAPGSAQ